MHTETLPIRTKRWRYIFYSGVLLFALIAITEFYPGAKDTVGQGAKLLKQIKIGELHAQYEMELVNAQTENKKRREKIFTLSNTSFEGETVGSIIRELNTHTAEYDITMISVKPADIRLNRDFAVQPVEISFVSTYEDFFGYLVRLDSSDSNIVINSLRINGTTEDDNMVNVLLAVEIYFSRYLYETK